MTARIQSIDFLRGVVMVLMVVDHARFFLHNGQVNPEDVEKTTPILFFTRWITHFCAPVFIFLVGTAAFLMKQKGLSNRQLSGFLLTRGLFLVLLELFLFPFFWQRSIPFVDSFVMLLVIWAIGISMIFLALLIWLPYRLIAAFGLIVLLLHNLLAVVHFPENSFMGVVWAFLYQGGGTQIGSLQVNILYPVIPYFGLVALGYCLGYLYTPAFTPLRRRKILTILGAGAILLFVILRAGNWYGDPHPWQTGKDLTHTVMAFLRTTKYPVSLLYTLMTLGPALLVLAWIEPVNNAITRFFVLIGRVPMFFYILHLFLLVLLGLIVGFRKFDLLAVYGWFAITVFILYLLCRPYARYKFSHPEKRWLSYL